MHSLCWSMWAWDHPSRRNVRCTESLGRSPVLGALSECPGVRTTLPERPRAGAISPTSPRASLCCVRADGGCASRAPAPASMKMHRRVAGCGGVSPDTCVCRRVVFHVEQRLVRLTCECVWAPPNGLGCRTGPIPQTGCLSSRDRIRPTRTGHAGTARAAILCILFHVEHGSARTPQPDPAGRRLHGQRVL